MAIFSFIKLCFLVLIFAGFFGIQSDCSSQVHPKAALFIFGDSLFDPGNNNFINTTTSLQANFSPYGETFFKFPTGRFSDGRLIPDFIAEYANLPLIPPYLESKHNYQLPYYGVNFASAGAGALVGTYSGLVIDLKTQSRYMKKVAKQLRSKLGEKEAKFLLSNGVYLFTIGANDYFFRFSANYSAIKVHGQEFAQQVLGNFTHVIKDIYKEGGRKFGFLNMASLACTPAIRATNNGECVEEFTYLAKIHNILFYEKIKELKKKLHGFHYSIFDFFGTATEKLNNPSKFGFKEVKSACCGTGPFRGINSCGGKRGGIANFEVCDNVGEYFFFDAGHLTESAYKQFAEQMWNGDSEIIKPYNLKSLFHLTV